MMHQCAQNARSPPYISVLNTNDVLQGRGAASDRFEGNIRFRALVRQRQAEYRSSSQKEDKARIALEIMETVQAVGGRFLRKVDSISEAEMLGIPPEQQGWLPIEETDALEKVKQALRDKRHESLPPESSPTASSVSTTVASHGHSVLGGPTHLSPTVHAEIGRDHFAFSPDHRSIVAQLPTAPLADEPNQNPLRPQLSGSNQHRGQSEDQTYGHYAHSPLILGAQPPMEQPHHLARAAIPHRLMDVAPRLTPPQRFTLPVASQNSMYHALVQVQREQHLQQQLAGVLAGDSVNVSPSELSASQRIAASWRDIPETYQTLFPVVQQSLGPHFMSKDLRVLLLTMALAESASDVSCLRQLRIVLSSVQQLPSARMRLDHDETQRLAFAAHRLQALFDGGPGLGAQST